MTGTRPQLTATLNGDTVDVTPFMAPGGGEGGGDSGEQWSSEPLDLAVLDSFDGTFDLKAKSFIAGENRIDNLDARFVVKDGVLDVERMTGNIYGGSVDLAGSRVTGRGTPTARIRAIGSGLDSGQLMSAGILGATFSGPVSFTGNFDTAGASLNEMMHALDGNGNVDGTIRVLTRTEQAIGSALLGVLGQQVQQLRGITDTINALFSAFTGRDNSLTGDFIVTDGVLQTDNARLANEAASLLAQGTADIGNWTMDMLAEIYRQQTGTAPFMVLDLTGPLGGPNVALREGSGVTPEGVTPTGQGLVEQVLPGLGTGEGTAEEGVGGLIEGILPGSGEATPPAGEIVDPNAPGASGALTTTPEATEETAPAAVEEIAPEAAVEPEQPAEEVAPGAEGLTTEPAAEEPAVEEPAVEEPAAEEPAVEEPAAEEPAAEVAPGAEGLTTEPAAEPAAEEPAAEEPAVEEPAAEEPAAEEVAPGASGLSTEPAAEPAAEPAVEEPAATTEELAPAEEPAAPGAEGAEPGAEPLPQDDTSQSEQQPLLQGILGTEQQ
jgi:hypothetical protein